MRICVLTKSMPAMYSSMVISFSRQKSCKCLVRLAMTVRRRGLALGPVALMTFSVKFGSNLDMPVVLPVVPFAPLAPPFATPWLPSCSGASDKGSCTLLYIVEGTPG